jgi:hypothetical protein
VVSSLIFIAAIIGIIICCIRRRRQQAALRGGMINVQPNAYGYRKNILT